MGNKETVCFFFIISNGLGSGLMGFNTGLPAYSDIVGSAKNCHCKQNVTVTGIFRGSTADTRRNGCPKSLSEEIERVKSNPTGHQGLSGEPPPPTTA